MSEKINLKEDRDFFIREFRKNVLNESVGGYLNNMLADLRQTIERLADPDNRSAKGVTDQDVKAMIKQLDKLELVMKQKLSRKGLSGW